MNKETIIAATIWIWLFGLIAAVIAERKGRYGFGWFWVGALLGPVGIIIAAAQRRVAA